MKIADPLTSIQRKALYLLSDQDDWAYPTDIGSMNGNAYCQLAIRGYADWRPTDGYTQSGARTKSRQYRINDAGRKWLLQNAPELEARAAADQPAPMPGQTRVDVSAYDRMQYAPGVTADLVARSELGLQRYGTRLCTFNGRDALVDLYQELLDAVMYAEQVWLESKEVRDDRLASDVGMLAEAVRHRLDERNAVLPNAG